MEVSDAINGKFRILYLLLLVENLLVEKHSSNVSRPRLRLSSATHELYDLGQWLDICETQFSHLLSGVILMTSQGYCEN